MKNMMLMTLLMVSTLFAQDVTQLSQFPLSAVQDGHGTPRNLVLFQNELWFTGFGAEGQLLLFSYDGETLTARMHLDYQMWDLHVAGDNLYVVTLDSSEFDWMYHIYGVSGSDLSVARLTGFLGAENYDTNDEGILYKEEVKPFEYGLYWAKQGSVKPEMFVAWDRYAFEAFFNQGWAYISNNQTGQKIVTDGTAANTSDVGVDFDDEERYARLSNGGTLFRADHAQGPLYVINGSSYEPLLLDGQPFSGEWRATYPNGGVVLKVDDTTYYSYDPSTGFESLPIEGSVIIGREFGDRLILHGSGRIYVSDGTPEGTTDILPDPFTTSFTVVPVPGVDYFYVTTRTSTYGTYIYDSEGQFRKVTPLESYDYKGLFGTAAVFSDEQGMYLLEVDVLRELFSSEGDTLRDAFVNGASDGTLFFTAETFGQTRSFVSDGTSEGTVKVADSQPYEAWFLGNIMIYFSMDGVYSNGYSQRLPFADPTTAAVFWNGLNYFGATGENGDELWVSDGSPTNTRELLNLYRDARTATLDAAVSAGGYLHFLHDGTYYRSNGVNLERSLGDVVVDALYEVDGTLYMSRGGALYALSGSEETLIADGVTGLSELRHFGDGLVALQDGTTGLAVAVIDGGVVTRLSLADPGFLEVKDGLIYFVRDGKLHGSLGAANDVFSLMTGTYGGVFSEPISYGIFDNQFLFMMDDGAFTPWLSGGTEATTYPLTRSQYWSMDGAAVRHDFVDVDGVIYFNNRHEVWKTTRRESETELAFALPEDRVIERVFHNSRGFLVIAGYENDYELWRSRGDQGSTYKLQDLWNLDLNEFLVSGDVLYFVASSHEQGIELMRTDGTAAGTYAVADLWAGAYSSKPRMLRKAGNQLFFVADTRDAGAQLYTFCDVPDVTVTSTPLCVGREAVLSVPEGVAGSTYEWTITGATPLNTEGNDVRIRVDAQTVLAEVTVTYPTGCSATGNLQRIGADTEAPPVVPVITGPTSVCGNDRDLFFSVNNPVAGLYYDWDLPPGASIVNGQGTAWITVNWGAFAGDVTVNTINGCGELGSAPFGVTLQNAPVVIDAGANFTSCVEETWLDGRLEGDYVGMWTVEEGVGGAFSDAHDPAARFSGQAGTEYRLRWSAAAVGCQPIYAEVRVRFSDAAPLAAWGRALDVRGLVEHFSACGR